MNGTRFGIAGALCAVLVIASACQAKRQAYGDPNSVIVVTSVERWDEIADDAYDAFEQTITTVRNEKKFTVTYQEPGGEHWTNLRRFRQMLVVGSRGDAWVDAVLDAAREDITTDGAHQVYDVWAAGQTVTLLLLPQGWTREDAAPYLVEVADLLDGQYRTYARNRMYMSGRDSALADTLEINHGFALDLPKVYRWKGEDSVFTFRNDNPDPSELIREIVVTWVSPAPTRISTEALLDWRAELVSAHYSEPQDVVLDGLIERSFDENGHTVQEVQAQWRNPPSLGWPAGGPFVTRGVTCDSQDRTYLIDAWLYAPGKEKYEYMIQLETILGSFRCG